MIKGHNNRMFFDLEHSDKGWNLGQDVTYKPSCRDRAFCLLSALIALKALESCFLSKLTSSSAPLFHPEIFVFFQFHVGRVLGKSSTRPVARCEFPSVLAVVEWCNRVMCLFIHKQSEYNEQLEESPFRLMSQCWHSFYNCHDKSSDGSNKWEAW